LRGVARASTLRMLGLAVRSRSGRPACGAFGLAVLGVHDPVGGRVVGRRGGARRSRSSKARSRPRPIRLQRTRAPRPGASGSSSVSPLSRAQRFWC
jgi:hypothetical protein